MTTRVRSAAILLLLALLGGGLGLPLFDALAFHSYPGRRPRAERLLGEEGSGPAHIQVCQLNHAVPAERSLHSPPVRAAFVGRVSTNQPPSTLRAAQSAPPAPTQLSRAPPSV